MAYQKLTPIIATGATAPRYLGDRFADIVNVLDFGALGDGVTDDSNAFSAAATAANGKPVFVPVGTYQLDSDVSGNYYSIGDVVVTGVGDVSITNMLAMVKLDGGNASDIGKTLSTYMAHAAMPDFSHQVQVSLPYTTPADGWMRFLGVANPTHPSTTVLYSTDQGVFAISWDGVANTVQNMCLVPVGKNTVVTLSTGSLSSCSFIYANGSVPA